MTRRIVALLLSLAVAGCSAGSTERARSATQPASAVPVQSPSETSPALPNSDAFDTTLSPVTAAQVIGGVYKGFDFRGIDPPNHPAPFAGGDTFPVIGDYFSARTLAETAMGQTLDATCRWVRDGATRVLVRSNLPAPEHAKVMERIRSALTEAAAVAAPVTQPAASNPNP